MKSFSDIFFTLSLLMPAGLWGMQPSAAVICRIKNIRQQECGQPFKNEGALRVHRRVTMALRLIIGTTKPATRAFLKNKIQGSFHHFLLYSRPERTSSIVVNPSLILRIPSSINNVIPSAIACLRSNEVSARSIVSFAMLGVIDINSNTANRPL